MESSDLSDREIQRRLAEAVTAYARRVLEGGSFPPFPEDAEGGEVSQTDVAISAAAMLRQAGVYSFELAAMFNV